MKAAADRRTFLFMMNAVLVSVTTASCGFPPFDGDVELDEAKRQMIAVLSDTLIPDTDAPGALAAEVDKAFLAMLDEWAAPSHRQALLSILEEIESSALAYGGSGFADLSPESRVDFLRAYDEENLNSGSGYRELKNLLVALYYYSETGATQELRYEHIPGVWEPSIPVTEETRAWAGTPAF